MTDAPPETPFYLIRIQLRHAHRPIWREVEVPALIRLSDLHDVIQAAMGWADVHLHEFVFGKRRFIAPDSEIEAFGSEEDERTVALGDLLKKARQKLRYIYDFGDNWEHEVILKKRLGNKPWNALRCVAGEGACPEEDCGGVWGHEAICAAIESRDDARASEYEGLVSVGYDPAAFDLEEVNEDLDFGEDLMDGEREESGVARHPYTGLDAADLAVYRSVLEEGLALRAVEPWKYLWDHDIFCIEDPDTGILDIISVLGAGRQVYSLQVHRGLEGLEFWRQMMLGEMSSDPDAFQSMLNVLELEFLDNTEMEEPDLDLYALTGLPNPKRGKNRWMRVRRYRPRQPCWFHPVEELSELRRGIGLARRYLALLKEAKGGSSFSYERARDKGGQLPADLPGLRLPAGASPEVWENWELARIPIDWSQVPAPPPIFEPSEFELARCGALKLADECWEVGAIEMPVVMEEAGPVRPLLAALCNLGDEQNVAEPLLLADPEVSPSESVWKVFIKYSLDREVLPRQLEVTTDIGERTFAPLRGFGVTVLKVPRHTHLDNFFLGALRFG